MSDNRFRIRRDDVARVYDCLAAVPGWQDGYGARTASVQGAIKYAKDMQIISRHCKIALFALIERHADLSPNERREDYESEIRKAEAYVNDRKKSDWASV